MKKDLEKVIKKFRNNLKKINKFSSIKYLEEIKVSKMIKESGLFDGEWYIKEYGIEINPLLHYLEEGWKLGYNPSNSFSTSQYLKNNQDVDKAKINPLLHYLSFGKSEGRTDKRYIDNETIDLEFFRKNSLNHDSISTFEFDGTIDIVLPIFNGFQFFDDLFSSLPQTKLKYRLIIVEDKSSDSRVLPYLENYAKLNSNTVLLRNSQNLGFVKSVNTALRFASNHVALINSDVIFPNEWLERLMFPILHDSNIATSTPYTNCGTICSFPNIAHDNELFLGLDLSIIDKEFKKIKPRFTEIPTGVGFCMGMSKIAVRKIGLLNEDLFGKGYGEENDWCQRAIKEGYKNVQVENLFVFHKHGGSFQSIEKKILIEKHLSILNKLYPSYGIDVQQFLEQDPNFDIRQFVQIQLLMSVVAPSILVFNHTWGGGSNDYLLQKIDELKDTKFIVISYNETTSLFQVSLYYKKVELSSIFSNLSLCLDMATNIAEIWINQLVGFQDIHNLIGRIIELSNRTGAPITFLLHDFYSLCPTINLMKNNKVFCGLPNLVECQSCLECNMFIAYKEFNETGEVKLSISTWRDSWESLLIKSKRVIVFSNNSRELFRKIYPNVSNIEVIPHKIKPFEQSKLNSLKLKQKKIVVGVLGAISTPKGLHIIEEMVKIIDDQKLNMKVVIIGYPEYFIDSRSFEFTGKYNRNEIPDLILENEIDLFLIPSVWPETFSYTTEEIIHLGMWLFVFDLGAQAERVKKYVKGKVIPEINAQVAIESIVMHFKEMEKLKNEQKE